MSNLYSILTILLCKPGFTDLGTLCVGFRISARHILKPAANLMRLCTNWLMLHANIPSVCATQKGYFPKGKVGQTYA